MTTPITTSRLDRGIPKIEKLEVGGLSVTGDVAEVDGLDAEADTAIEEVDMVDGVIDAVVAEIEESEATFEVDVREITVDIMEALPVVPMITTEEG